MNNINEEMSGLAETPNLLTPQSDSRCKVIGPNNTLPVKVTSWKKTKRFIRRLFCFAGPTTKSSGSEDLSVQIAAEPVVTEIDAVSCSMDDAHQPMVMAIQLVEGPAAPETPMDSKLDIIHPEQRYINSTTATTLQQAAEVLECDQQTISRATNTDAATHMTLQAEMVEQMTPTQLQSDPALWAAYKRGWVDRMSYNTVISGDPTTSVRDNYRSRIPRFVKRQAETPRTSPIRPSSRASSERPPSRTSIITRPISVTAVNPLVNTVTTPTPVFKNSRQRRNLKRLLEYREKVRLQNSQQYRLEKPPTSETTTSPANTRSTLAGGDGPNPLRFRGTGGNITSSDLEQPEPRADRQPTTNHSSYRSILRYHRKRITE